MTISLSNISKLVFVAVAVLAMAFITTVGASAEGNDNNNDYKKCERDRNDEQKSYNDKDHRKKCKAPAPVFTDATCETEGSYTIPESRRYTYKVNHEVVEAGTYPAEQGSSVTVHAKKSKHHINERNSKQDKKNHWEHTFAVVDEADCVVPVVKTEEPQVLAAVTQVTETPTGAVDAGGSGTTALLGLVGSTVVLGAGAVARKFTA